MRRGEMDGINYHFVTNRMQMEQDIESNLFVEAGVYGGHLYGMSSESILQVAKMVGSWNRLLLFQGIFNAVFAGFFTVPHIILQDT